MPWKNLGRGKRPLDTPAGPTIADVHVAARTAQIHVAGLHSMMNTLQTELSMVRAELANVAGALAVSVDSLTFITDMIKSGARTPPTVWRHPGIPDPLSGLNAASSQPPPIFRMDPHE